MTAKSLRYIKWGFVLMFFNINIGRFDLLPNFAGVLLLIMALRSQWEETETEKRLEPLLTALVIDYFLHWIFAFDNGVENLINYQHLYHLCVSGRSDGTRRRQATGDCRNASEGKAWLCAFTGPELCLWGL